MTAIPAFTHQDRATHVVFGTGCVQRLGDAVGDHLNGERALVISTPGRRPLVERIRKILGARWIGGFDGAAVHVPGARVEQAMDRVAADVPDVLISVGGGSAVGMGKAVARESGLPLAAVPTTYSGSEATSIWGRTDGDRKQTGRDERVAPRLIVYDPHLTYELPAEVSGPSGMNAIAHCVEALYSTVANPVATLLAEEGIRLLARSLPIVRTAPRDDGARRDALLGAYYAGRALDLTTMGLHHKVCHVLGGTFGLPHALTHAVFLPHAVAYNAPAAPEAMAAAARALGTAGAPTGLFDLNARLAIPTTLAELGLRESDLDRAAALAVADRYPNPREVTLPGVRAVLEAAFRGSSPMRG